MHATQEERINARETYLSRAGIEYRTDNHEPFSEDAVNTICDPPSTTDPTDPVPGLAKTLDELRADVHDAVTRAWDKGYIAGHRQGCPGRCTHPVLRNPLR